MLEVVGRCRFGFPEPFVRKAEQMATKPVSTNHATAWTKRLRAWGLSTLMVMATYAQATVDLKMERVNTSGLRVSLRNNGPTFGNLVSSIVFTLRWPAAMEAVPGVNTLGCEGGMMVTESGPIVVDGGFQYQTYVAFGMATLQNTCPDHLLNSGEWRELCVIIVENQGATCTGYEIVNDGFTQGNNRNYYISFGGSDVTGSIIPNTVLFGADCSCDHNVNLIIQPDANSSETTWQLIEQGTDISVCAGEGYPDGVSAITESCCLPDGCYRLVVYDAAGDGMVSNGTTGGYILQSPSDAQRLIDNRFNFDGVFNGSQSAIAGSEGFCLPMGAVQPIFSNRDKLDWVNNQFFVCGADPAVSAVWVTGGSNGQQSATTGYEFWFFDPNGGYSFKRFRSHATSDGYGTGATRACHLKINGWAAASHIPAYDLMNVRIRPRINGVNGEWGPATRFKIDPERAACPLTKLIHDPSHQYFSCGVTRTLGNGAASRVYANPVTGANRYQFRYRIPAEGFEVVRTNTTYISQLNWTGPTALQVGKTYEVDVRVSKDAGVTWCTEGPLWGDICTVTIVPTPPGMANEGGNGSDGGGVSGAIPMLRATPNPVDQGTVRLDLLQAELKGVAVDLDLYDPTGRSVRHVHQPASDAASQTWNLDVSDLASGLYSIRFTAGELVLVEPLYINR